jgi:HTH-type transcriptional regulator, transcriptional repressor of NAD biosynthesis genes
VEGGLRGLIVGKFYPPHAGHHHLIDTALAEVDELHVVIGDHPREDLPWRLRWAWLAEAHPRVQLHRIEDQWGADSFAWARACLAELGPVDVVFTSEAYGEEFARALGARHVPVDPPRRQVPVSGTLVRENFERYWTFLRAPARRWFCRRVVLVGAESTGKTTLAQHLAEVFSGRGAAWVPEYGRQWCEERVAGMPDPLAALEALVWKKEDFVEIAREQSRQEEEAGARAPLLFCDTDALATALWAERYLGCTVPELSAWKAPESRVRRLYLLCGADAPFVQDGLRDGEGIRDWMQGRFEEILRARGEDFVVLQGSWEERDRRARAALE